MTSCSSPRHCKVTSKCRLTRRHSVPRVNSWSMASGPACARPTKNAISGEFEVSEGDVNSPGHLSDTFEHGIVRTRVAHRNGTSTTYFNGNPVLRQSRLKQPYPWLAIRSHAGVLPRVSDLRISGNPTIPDQISLVESKELLGWYDFFQRPGIPTLNRWQGEVANSSGHLKTTITAHTPVGTCSGLPRRAASRLRTADA